MVHSGSHTAQAVEAGESLSSQPLLQRGQASEETLSQGEQNPQEPELRLSSTGTHVHLLVDSMNMSPRTLPQRQRQRPLEVLDDPLTAQ